MRARSSIEGVLRAERADRGPSAGPTRRHSSWVPDGSEVKRDQVIFTWDPYTNPIISDVEGTIRFVDIVEEESVSEELDELTGLRQRVIIEDREKKLHPHIEIVQEKSGKERRVRDFIIPAGAQLTVEDGAHTAAGTTLAKVGREAYKTRDITGGLPRRRVV